MLGYIGATAKLSRKQVIKEDKDKTARPSEEEQVPQRSSRLPQLDIAVFNGSDITQYTPFMEMFKTIVDSDATLSETQKLCYLKKYLRGDALVLIDSLPLLSESYKQALELLDNRYNNKCLLITHHVNLILDLQPISKGSSQELRHLVSLLRQHLGALKNLGQQRKWC